MSMKVTPTFIILEYKAHAQGNTNIYTEPDLEFAVQHPKAGIIDTNIRSYILHLDGSK